MDRMSDLFVTGPLLGNIENNKLYSNRWTGVASFILDGEDDSDRSYYTEPIMGEEHSRGDYATSLKLKPKFTLSVRDKQTNWSYYFETYYMSNGIGIDLDKNERRKSETRLHGEARWSDQYSKGKYGFNIGYRNETTSAPTFSAYVGADRLKRGLHQFRFTPNFTYNLGNGFIFGGQTTGIIAYDYEGYRKGQTDFELENEYGITMTYEEKEEVEKMCKLSEYVWEKGLREGREEGLRTGRNYGELQNLVRMVLKKMRKDVSYEITAELFEEPVEKIRKIYEVAEKYAPEYDIESICRELAA